MSFGALIKNVNDQVVTELTEPSLRVIAKIEIPALTSGSHAIPGYGPLNAYAYCESVIPAGLTGTALNNARETGATVLNVWLTTGQVHWTGMQILPSGLHNRALPGVIFVVARR